jgi:uncharacterized protein
MNTNIKIITSLIFLIKGLYGIAQCSEDSVKAFQKRMNVEFSDSLESPLLDNDRKHFTSLNFYPIDLKYCVMADFKRTANETKFLMPTTTDRKVYYVKYGILNFKIDDVVYSLNVYQNIELSKTEQYKNYLFLPFTDLSNGFETYGGGRFIDLEITDGEQMVVDFNKAYNPSCAYNHKYSCPIPPKENRLNLKIKAGVKKFHD